MYKAFYTFIDDLFAFIITMPTAHRVACVRDDVFLIYLYQSYLYPVSAQSGGKVKSLAEIQAEEARVEKERWVEQFFTSLLKKLLYLSISGNITNY